MPLPIRRLLNRFFRTKESDPNIIFEKEEVVALELLVGYDHTISKHIPFYNLLSIAEKNRFLNRVWHFKQHKRFHFTGMDELAEVSILVSAAAVQLTFGLRKYRLTYFKDIYIMPDAYQFENAADLYIGHVSPKGIYISWKHFLQGYANEKDNVNVAIHEMAHALEYNNFLKHNGIDHEFRSDFMMLPSIYGPSLANIIVNKRCYLRTYAYSNIREFWAVSVEAFFENPCELRGAMPRLYNVIAEILNQDYCSGLRKITKEKFDQAS